MSDKTIFGCAETGSYQTSAPNPHIELSGTASGSAYSIAQLFADAMSTDETATVSIVKDKDNWAVYGGVKFTNSTPDTLDLSVATLLESKGTLSDEDAVTCLGINPQNGPVLLNRQVADNSTNLVFALPSTYTRFELVFSNFRPATAAKSLYMTISDDGGSTYKSSGYRYAMNFAGGHPVASGQGGKQSASDIFLSGVHYNVAPATASAKYNITGTKAGDYFTIFGQNPGTASDSNNYLFIVNNAGVYLADTNLTTNIKLFCDSGNIAIGTFELWGYR